MANPNFDTLASSTLRNYRSKIVENLMGQQALFWQLKERGFTGEEQGGTSLTHPILYSDNTTASSYSGYDELDVTPQEGFTTVELDWKQLSASIAISGREQIINQGDKTKIFSLLDGKIQQAEISLKKIFNEQLFADGTGNASKDLTGLALAVEDGTAWSTYGGIDSNTYTFWRNQWLDFDAAYTSFGTAAGPTTEGIKAMRTMFNRCVRAKSKTTLIVTTVDLYEAYEANAEGQKLQLVDTKMADVGFTNIAFKKVPVIFDEDCPANTMLFLNSEFMKLINAKGRNFITTPFQRPDNQDAKVAQILYAGNLVVYKRDQQGRIGNFIP
jgi:hypothetical protein